MQRETRTLSWVGPPPLHNPLDVPRLSEIYSRTAAFYDEVVAAQQAPAKLAAIDLLQRRRGERFLEVGAGTGWAFSRVIEASGEAGAFALEVAQGMLQVCREAVRERANVSPSLLLGDGRTLPFPEASLDCILTSYTFEVLPEAQIPLVIAEIRRVLRPQGRAVVVNLTDATDGGAKDEGMIADWKRRYVSDPEFFGGARPLQLSGMLQAGGLVVDERHYVGPDWPSEVLRVRKPSS